MLAKRAELLDDCFDFLRFLVDLLAALTFPKEISRPCGLLLQLFAVAIVEIVQLLALFHQLVVQDYHFRDDQRLIVIQVLLQIVFLQLYVLLLQQLNFVVPLFVFLLKLLLLVLQVDVLLLLGVVLLLVNEKILTLFV